MSKETDAALDAALKELDKEYGKGTVMKFGDKPQLDIEVIDSGSLKINEALGIGGWPRGRVVEIFGPEASGKTTLCIHAIAEVQKAGGKAAFIDVEHALDTVYAQNLGVDIDNLYISQPDNGEQALEILDTLTATHAFSLIIIDSVAALVPKAEIEGNMGDAQMALQARLMSQALRKLTPSISKSNTCVMFTNQLRMKIGVFFGNPETVTGGNALKFYASIRVDIRRGSDINIGTKEDKNIIGSNPKVTIKKNKLAPPHKVAMIEVIFGEGISRDAEVIDLGVKYDIIEKSGSWYSYGEEQIGQGLINVKTFLKDNPKVKDEIERKVMEIYTSRRSKDVKAAVIEEKTASTKKTRVLKDDPKEKDPKKK